MALRPEREKLIKEKLEAEEAVERRDSEAIKRAMLSFLRGKGYLPEEIEADRGFEFSVDGRARTASLDFVVRPGGRSLIAVKCAPSAIESRERHVVALARIIEPLQIPYSVVTDGSEARLIDTISGKTVAEGMEAIPGREEALRLMDGIRFVKYPKERLEREKRILIAFEGIGCPIEGGQGGAEGR